MSGLSKQFLFGDALDGIDTGGLNLAEFGLNNLIEQAKKIQTMKIKVKIITTKIMKIIMTI